MSGPRILVTGAAGFVGRHMLAALRAAFADAVIVGAAREAEVPAEGLAGAAESVAFDLLQPAGMADLVRQARPDMCVHLAAFADVAASFAAPEEAWRANVDGTRALAAALMQGAPGCLLLHAGSAEAYGLSFQSGAALDEQAPLRPANPYAAAKAAIDIALGEMALRGLRVIRMRPLNHVGPGQSDRFAVSAFARQIARIEAGLQPPVIQTGALDRARDFLDVRDVCAGYVAALRAPALPVASVFNLASGTARVMGDVLAELLEVAGVSARVETAAAALRPVDLARTSCSAAAARAALGWAPRVPWAKTLRDIVEDWRGRVKV